MKKYLRSEFQKKTTTWETNQGQTYLHFAAYLGDVDATRMLIEDNADVNAGDFKGWTALHIAARDGPPLRNEIFSSEQYTIDFPFFITVTKPKKKSKVQHFQKNTHTQTHRAIKFIFIRFFFYKKNVFQVTKEDFFLR